MTKPLAAALLSILVPGLWTASQAAGQTVADTSYRATDGTRVLRHEIVVDAPREQVWDAFTTADGWMSWAAPMAVVDFRRGGSIETSYDPAATAGDPANIRHEILSYLPGEMLSLRAVQVPPDFPYQDLVDELWAVFLFEDAGPGRTRVVSAGAGYRDGEGYDTIYGFFQQGNAFMLQQLERRFQEGPVDWDEALEAIARHEEAGGADGR